MTSDQQHHQPNHHHEEVRKPTNFTIDHILHGAGNSRSSPKIASSVGVFPSAAQIADYRNRDLLRWRDEECLQSTSQRKTESFDYQEAEMPFTWLQCTRYCPPKVPRKREGPQKRQLGRHPRIPFTSHQLAILEEKFKQSAYLSSEEVTQLSKSLELADIRVKIWFQNRRARDRREKLSMEQLTEKGSPS